MRILTVSHFFESHGGGLERVAAHLNREFARAGHQATWCACGNSETADEFTRIPLKCINPIERITGLPLPIAGFSAIRSLLGAIRESDAIVIHDSLYFTSVAAAVLANFFKKPVVLVQHIADIQFKSRAKRSLMWLANSVVTRPMIATADKLVFISDQVRCKLIGNPPRRSFMLLYNGVNSSIFFLGPAASVPSIRSRYEIPNHGRVLLFVGRFVEKKGLEILRAIALKSPDLHFVLVGAGPIAPQSWSLSNVQVLPPQSPQGVAELYRAADLLILPSVGEGFPLVVQEAMASGVPIVCGIDSASADPRASQWLSGVEINLTDVAGSAARCIAAISRCLEVPIDTAQMARYATHAYSWTRMAEKITGSLSERT